MKETKIIMGMPIAVEIIDKNFDRKIFQEVFDYFYEIDNKFSPYKKTSEVSLLNAGKILPSKISKEMREIFRIAEDVKKSTDGYFDIYHKGKLDPSGIVKGWAINNAAKILRKKGVKNFYIDAGGDIQTSGINSKNKPWRVGIRNPFNRFQNVKILEVFDRGIATSGTAIRGQHIYNPYKETVLDEILSITVVGPNVYEADLLATAAFAMQKEGIYFLEKKKNFEGYMIDKRGIATYTSGFENYVV